MPRFSRMRQDHEEIASYHVSMIYSHIFQNRLCFFPTKKMHPAVSSYPLQTRRRTLPLRSKYIGPSFVAVPLIAGPGGIRTQRIQGGRCISSHLAVRDFCKHAAVRDISLLTELDPSAFATSYIFLQFVDKDLSWTEALRCFPQVLFPVALSAPCVVRRYIPHSNILFWEICYDTDWFLSFLQRQPETTDR